MIEPSNPAIAAALRNPRLIDEAMSRAARRAVLEHARAGRAVCASDKDGKVVWIQPAEILATVQDPDQEPDAPLIVWRDA